MLPWTVIGLLNSLMVFFLVFFLSQVRASAAAPLPRCYRTHTLRSRWMRSPRIRPHGSGPMDEGRGTFAQCYGRYNEYFNLCFDIEASIQETTMQMLVHMKDAEARWDVVRRSLIQ